MGQTTLFLFAFNAILVYNKMNYMLVQENKEKGEMMLAEMKEIILIIEEFCIDNCIIILACANALALLLAVICLVRTSKKKHTKRKSDESEEMLLNLNIKKAEVNIAQVSREFENKLISESAQPAEEQPEPEVPPAGEERNEQVKPNTVSDPVVIEKLIPIEAKKIETEEFYTSRSGKVYSEEEIQSQIRD